MDKVAQAIELASSLHNEQLDKGGQPYILHPIRVMLEFKDPISMKAAVLHDTVEDTAYTIEKARKDFGDEVAETLDSVTRREGETYMDFIRRCSLNRRGRKLKLMDIKDNTRPERYNPNLTGLQGRYIKAQAFIVDAMKDGDEDDIQFLYDKGFIPYFEYMMLMEKQ